MALVIHTYLICDKCGAPYGTDDLLATGFAHRENAVKDGWVRGAGSDHCQNCKFKRKEFYQRKKSKYKKRIKPDIIF